MKHPTHKNTVAKFLWASAACLAVLAAGAGGPAAQTDPTRTTVATVSFNRDVRPIMSGTCFRCHGPDESSRRAGMRLDIREEALKPRRNGTPIVPGQPGDSLIITRIFAEDPARVMPPAAIHKELTPAQKETIKQWIAEGARYEGQWAYQPLTRPSVPASPRALHPVDAFVQTRLDAEGVTPSPEADRRTLLRRLTLDLTGLVPTPAELEAFLADRSTTAYDKVVDRLMASPRYAEKQAISWLDAVRYADTVGFHGDNPFPAWPYRDWVLKAIRDNKPFDQFTREQLAGDLLPNATVDQKIASAYNRLNRVSGEGGLQEKEYLAKYGADRVRAVTTTWMASTLGCAECHDHKFDPFKSKDFYAMKAFFADINESGLARDGGGRNGLDAWGVKLQLPTPGQTQQLAAIKARAAEAKSRLAARTASLAAQRTAWEKATLERFERGDLRWQFMRPVAAAAEGATLTVHDDLAIRIGSLLRFIERPVTGLIVASGRNPDRDTYTVTLKPGAGTWQSLGIELERDDSLPGGFVARGGLGSELSELEAEMPADGGRPARKLTFAIGAMVAGNAQSGGVDLGPVNAIDGDLKTTWNVSDFGTSTANPFAAFHFSEPVVTTATSTLVIRLRQLSDTRRATLGRFRLALSHGSAWPDDGGRAALADDGTQNPDVKEYWGLPDRVARLLATPVSQRVAPVAVAAQTFFQADTPELAVLLADSAKLDAAAARLEDSITRVVVTEALPEPRETRVLPRGNWMDDSGAIVEPAIPEFMGTLDTGGRRATRLDLANWLVSPRNTLTARAFVNRTWRQFFGTGITSSLGDFGSQGEWPSHLDLLDWLASEFVQPQFKADGAHAWDMKHIVRTIVTSQTYKQSSAPRPELDARDPGNRLLARQMPLRVDAEVVHDVALQVSGLLVEKFGGRSVRPYQPDGYLAALNYPKRSYSADRGEDLYRRALYTHWQRTFLHPSLAVFDAPSREEHVLERVLSDTPLQSLDLLNDPIYVEAARVFAERVVKSGGGNLNRQLTWAFSRALGREPDAEERKTLGDLYARSLASYEKSPDEAAKLIRTGEYPVPADVAPARLAAMTTVTRVVLNLHELITRN
ncbi:MAG: DUF1553 domain-containing protein [Acidobacteriota bacterium]